MTKVALILQARMGSTRLAGKSMMDLAGAPLVGRIIERVKRCRRVNEVVLALPEGGSDDVLADLGRKMEVKVFRGAENDLVNRYCVAARFVGAEVIVRLPADNVCPEPEEIDKIIDFHLRENRGGFSTNLSPVFGNGYPDGIGAEVFDLRSLEEVDAVLTDSHKREHPHLNFLDYAAEQPANPARYPVRTIACPPAYARPELILDVNTMEQYEFLSALYRDLYPHKPDFHITDIVDWYDHVYSRRKLAAGSPSR